MTNRALENSARLAVRQGGMLLSIAFVLSFLVNVLRLSGPLFMILIYDRVLSSRSEETLFALLFMVAVLMIVLGLLDYSRKRIIARFAAQFQERLEQTILSAASLSAMFPVGKSKPAIGIDEADSLRGFFHSGGLLAIMDFIWAPMFVVVVFFLHPVLGYVCLAGMGVMLLLILIRITFLGGREERANESTKQISDLKNMVVASRSVVRSQDMSEGFKSRWMAARESGRDNAISLRDWTAWFDHLSQTTLLLVRYGVLATGAYFALQSQLTVGAMVASMFLVTRALIPVNRFVGVIPSIAKAMTTWKRLKSILASWEVEEEPYTADAGSNRVRVSLANISFRAATTGNLILRSVSLQVAPGKMIEILGGSGSGKTVLADIIAGARKRSAGSILSDGKNVASLNDRELAQTVGYMPETTEFIAGTLADNISHLDPEATPEKISAAARQACLHAWISALPKGYQTQIDPTGSEFSKGQRQQLSLARALYHEPKILIMDEPDAVLFERLPDTMKKTLDAFLKRGGVVIVLSRKPHKIQQARERLVLENGALKEVKSISATSDEDTGKTQRVASGSSKVTVLKETKKATGSKG
ncbi:ATP-binding cassette domain-containing protein [Aliiroseovarius sp. KMU-50]|uniref:ATP-binding cassette domain-containing protein n=1 Tax=Aliiroseovarius salicola TaxID=3009082 RepID=A0ABT4W1N9_9RHOB|nr:ATP-binding cassette domain-containing protein [Aliiroseovarius sp. KMU-50]MDA5094339.1 ATP-binding cassette domain-containing protein [Aliiroseovarius sp. KMU-50]